MSKRRAQFSIEEKEEEHVELPSIGKINTPEEIAQRRILRVKAPQSKNQPSGTRLIINAPPPSFAPAPEPVIKKADPIIESAEVKSEAVKQSQPIASIESNKPVESTSETPIDVVKPSEPNTPNIRIRTLDPVKDFNPQNPNPNTDPVETTNPTPPAPVQQGNPFMSADNPFPNIHPYVHEPIRHINPYGQSYGINPYSPEFYNNPFAQKTPNNQQINPMILLTPEDIAKLAEEEPTEPPKQKKVKKVIDFGPDFVPLENVKFWEEENFLDKFKHIVKEPLPKPEPFDAPKSPGYYERFWSKPFQPIFKSAFFKKPEHKFFANMNPPSFGVNPDYPEEAAKQMLKRAQSMPLPPPIQQLNITYPPYVPPPPPPKRPQGAENTAAIEFLKQLREGPRVEFPKFSADGSPFKPMVRAPTQEELAEERARRRIREQQEQEQQ